VPLGEDRCRFAFHVRITPRTASERLLEPVLKLAAGFLQRGGHRLVGGRGLLPVALGLGAGLLGVVAGLLGRAAGAFVLGDLVPGGLGALVGGGAGGAHLGEGVRSGFLQGRQPAA
jgi:hypothetical protein